MKEQWRNLSGRFAALALRERALVLAAVVLGAALVYDALALEPLALKKKRHTQQLAEARQGIKAAEGVLKAQEAVADPDAVKRSYRDALRKQLAEIDSSMQGLQRGLVPPERMAKLLEEMLAQSRGLQLAALRTLPVQRFESPGAAPAAKGDAKTARPQGPERAIYQHSFELTLQGSYADLHHYLARLEQLPWQMFWGRISVNTEQYPRLRVTLTVQTLSLNKAWLIV
ncbi:MAG: agglutinin biogenesis protein [Betaproteobacteria bacterium]|nr:agglutinin biogenesis protein [Betaproteobacteria bacterium]MBI2509704.1 agglutinin biogenesis protein [Betaproteobacteria bacterium]